MKSDTYQTTKATFEKLFDLDEYFDHILLDSDAFMEKYHYCGWSFPQRIEVRFPPEVDVLTIIQEFISEETGLIMIPVTPQRVAYHIEGEHLPAIFQENELPTADFLIFHLKHRWVLVKNKFNKLIGVGPYITKRIKKNCYLTDVTHEK